MTRYAVDRKTHRLAVWTLAVGVTGLGAAEPLPPYRAPTRSEVTEVLQRVGRHLAEVRPAVPPAATTGPTTGPTTAPITGPTVLSGGFGVVSYPMGVAYTGMLAAGEATGDPAFAGFVAGRFQSLADQYHALPADRDPRRRPRGPIGSLVVPRSLDDCGAVAAAILRARRAGVGPDLRPLSDGAVDWAEHRQYRLADGTVARNAPARDSLWADDMYMSVALLTQAGAAGHDPALVDDAARQVLQLGDRLFVPSAGLFTHGWNAATGDQQPRYHWGRANGWCAMAMAEVLDVLPANHPRRAAVLALFRQHARGLASCQGGTGLWHQMLDRPDSFPETSGSAMFTFALARGVNRGWLDPAAYGPVALSAWSALAAQVDAAGHVHGTCVGTNYADDYVYYYRRPIGDDDPHGYGPVLMAGAEVIRLLANPDLRVDGNGRGPTMVRDADGGR